MNTADQPNQTQTIRLDPYQLACLCFNQQRRIIVPMNGTVEFHPIEDGLKVATLTLHAKVTASTPQEVVIKYPRNWWQHVKQDLMPKWFTDRWPVTYQEQVVRFQQYIPEMPFPVEERRYHYRKFNGEATSEAPEKI